MTTTLEDLKAQLKAVASDLDTMSRGQAGTEWHRDRIEEARWLVKEIERREGRA